MFSAALSEGMAIPFHTGGSAQSILCVYFDFGLNAGTVDVVSFSLPGSAGGAFWNGWDSAETLGALTLKEVRLMDSALRLPRLEDDADAGMRTLCTL